MTASEEENKKKKKQQTGKWRRILEACSPPKTGDREPVTSDAPNLAPGAPHKPPNKSGHNDDDNDILLRRYYDTTTLYDTTTTLLRYNKEDSKN